MAKEEARKYRGDDKMVAEIRVYADPELKRLAGLEADKIGIPLSEFVVRALAEKLRRTDLQIIPRKPSGRPRKDMAAV